MGECTPNAGGSLDLTMEANVAEVARGEEKKFQTHSDPGGYQVTLVQHKTGTRYQQVAL